MNTIIQLINTYSPYHTKAVVTEIQPTIAIAETVFVFLLH